MGLQSTYNQNPIEENTIAHKYPLFVATKLRRTTLDRIRKYGTYGMSIDQITSKILDMFDEMLRHGYDVPKENRSF